MTLGEHFKYFSNCNKLKRYKNRANFHQVPGSLHQFENLHFFCLLDRCFHGTHFNNILSTVITLMYSQCTQFISF